MSTLGRPTEYKEEYDTRIIELAKKELSMWEIAAEFEVCYKTMWSWTHAVDSFRKAYARAKTIQTGLIMKEVRENKDNRNYNHNLPNMRLKYEAGLGEQAKIQIRDIAKGTHSQKANKVLCEIEEGNLTADDAAKITNVVATIAKIDEVTELRDKVEKLEECEGK